jgi:hypothetical protein
MAGFFDLMREFLAVNSPALLEVWGHSWELEGPGPRWADTERFFGMVAHRPDVCSLTHRELADYLNAFRRLRFSAAGNAVTNPSAVDVFIRAHGKVRRIAGGRTTILRR